MLKIFKQTRLLVQLAEVEKFFSFKKKNSPKQNYRQKAMSREEKFRNERLDGSKYTSYFTRSKDLLVDATFLQNQTFNLLCVASCVQRAVENMSFWQHVLD